MIINLQTWNKTIGSQEKNLNQIISTYNKLNDDVKKMKDTDEVSYLLTLDV